MKQGTFTDIEYSFRKKKNKRDEFLEIMTEAVPDETTLCNFCHLLEANSLNKLFFDAINRVMVQTGHTMKGGIIVDIPLRSR